ncbi:DNA-binding transcriptional LysR family regulator [Luteibacter sp. W1I16]|uniref:LysR substrate-binding domain-containing protein n=1 Tax=Luteibacter sp. W1I16 TaxID=3373922 RepID=UPI003D246C1E
MNDRPDIEIDLLRALVAVVEAGGFTPAAERLNRTQSAVSQKIARLERLLGWKVFGRNSRGLRLTARGESLLDDARRLLVRYEHFLGSVHAASTSTILRLGVSENLTLSRLPALLTRVRTSYPGLHIELSTGTSATLLADLEHGRLDIVVAKQGGARTSAHGRVAWREPMTWFAASSFRDEVGKAAPLVLMREPCAYREAAIAALDAVSRLWTIACTVDNVPGAEAAVLAGLGVTAQARSFARPGMKILHPSRRWPPLPGTEVAVYGRDPEWAPMVEALVGMLAVPEDAVRVSRTE